LYVCDDEDTERVQIPFVTDSDNDKGAHVLLSLLNTIAKLVKEKGIHGSLHSSSEEMNGVSFDDVTGAIQISEEQFDKELPDTQLHQALSDFFVRYYGNQSRIMKLLRCVDQAFVVSLLGHFSESLFMCEEPMRFKDVRGTWTIDVIKKKDTFSFVHR
jgi:hypothetical protein